MYGLGVFTPKMVENQRQRGPGRGSAGRGGALRGRSLKGCPWTVPFLQDAWFHDREQLAELERFERPGNGGPAVRSARVMPPSLVGGGIGAARVLHLAPARR